MQNTSACSSPPTSRSGHQRERKQITSSLELDATPSLINSFMDLESSLPEVKALSLKESDWGNMSMDTPSNSRSDTPARQRRRRRKPELSATNHKPSMGCTIFQLSLAQTTVCAYSWMTKPPCSTMTSETTPHQRGQSRKRDTPDGVVAAASSASSMNPNTADLKNRQSHNAINSETPP